jgi:hypothetical protein
MSKTIRIVDLLEAEKLPDRRRHTAEQGQLLLPPERVETRQDREFHQVHWIESKNALMLDIAMVSVSVEPAGQQ